MATHSSILAWRIPWTEEPHGLYSSWDCKESDTTERLTFSLFNGHLSFSNLSPLSTLLLDVMLFKEKKPILCDPIYTKWPEQENLERQRVDRWLCGPGGSGEGMTNDC